MNLIEPEVEELKFATLELGDILTIDTLGTFILVRDTNTQYIFRLLDGNYMGLNGTHESLVSITEATVATMSTRRNISRLYRSSEYDLQLIPKKEGKI